MYIRNFLFVAATGISLLMSGSAMAALTLDTDRSSLSFISYKVVADASTSVGERHTFSGLTGSVSDEGVATVSIALDSIETNIPIRNERLTKFLFETEKYPAATVTANIPQGVMSMGTSMLNLEITVSLHGKEQAMSVPVLVANANGEVSVTATEPVMLDAAAFDLGAGVGKLAELASLLHIPTTVPTSFSLVFTGAAN